MILKFKQKSTDRRIPMPFPLRLKHWQLFLALIVFPLVAALLFQAAFVLEMMEQAAKNARASMNPNDVAFPSAFKWFPILLVVIMAPLFAWFWSFGVTLHRYLPHPRMLNVVRFKVFLIIPFAYFILLAIWMAYLFQSLENMSNPPEPLGIPREFLTMMLSFIIIIPLHLFSMFCLIYTMRFCAKVLVSVERGQEAHFGDYIGEFFLIWFHFVGLWLIQPRIQAILNSKQPTALDFSDSPITQPIRARNANQKTPSENPSEEHKPLNFKPDDDPFTHDSDFDGIL